MAPVSARPRKNQSVTELAPAQVRFSTVGPTVLLKGAGHPDHPGLLSALSPDEFPRDVTGALELALLLGSVGVRPGDGDTDQLWEALASIASHDLGAARAIEPHLDALAILAQAPPGKLPAVAAAAECRWGVFAAEGSAEPLRASLSTADVAGDRPENAWVINGVKPWCSLADTLDAALVTVTLDDGSRALFAVDLKQSGVHTDNSAWQARGLTEIPSGPVRFTDVVGYPVGAPGWYLGRSGFSWGGIGVAACWFGGAVGLARTLFTTLEDREPDRIALMHLGAIDVQLQSARRALAEAAALVDSGDAEGAKGRLLAKRVRATVALACDDVALRVGHCLGPAPLAQDADHAKRVADLQLYVRQHHAERDEASLGEALLRTGVAPW
jgi:alkylation response protein AidB-like acyl-CoA dehydrogenase